MKRKGGDRNEKREVLISNPEAAEFNEKELKGGIMDEFIKDFADSLADKGSSEKMESKFSSKKTNRKGNYI